MPAASLTIRGLLPAALAGALALAGAPQSTAAPSTIAFRRQVTSSFQELSEVERTLAAASGWTGDTFSSRRAAARRFVELGSDASDYLLAQIKGNPNALAEAGPALVEGAGSFEADELRGELWTALTAPRFPWRIAAARGLSAHPQPDEAPAFEAFLDDPVADIRVAALTGLRNLDHRADSDRLRELLSDASGAVRRAAADLLLEQQQGWALAWLIEELQRTDTFIGSEDGLAARKDARRIVARHLGEDFGFQPELDPFNSANKKALSALLDRFTEVTGGTIVSLPGIARAGQPLDDIVLGFEVSSSEFGRISLRWNGGGDLWIGRGKPLRIPAAHVDAGELWNTVAKALATIPVEQLAHEGDYERIWVRRGSKMVPYLVTRNHPTRAAGFEAGLKALLATLSEQVPATHADLRASALTLRVTEALTAVAGPIDG